MGQQQLVRFVNEEATLSELPLLESWAARLRFAMISERWIESRHSLMKRSLASSPSVSAAYVAFQGILTPLRKLLVEEPQAIDLERLAALCMVTRNAQMALKNMGLWTHPSIQAHLTATHGSKGQLGRGFRPEVVRVIYHVDDATLYQPLPDPHPPPPTAPAGQMSAQPPGSSGHGPNMSSQIGQHCCASVMYG